MVNQSEKMAQESIEVATKAAGTGGVALLFPPWLSRDWFFGLILVLAVILVYQPIWYAGFVWDDDMHVTANPCIVGPLGLKEIWTTSAGQFFPLVLTTFWVEHTLWGLAPLPYHLVNVFEQAMCAVLLWRVLRNLQVPGAWLGAALWALHPVQVESVAWISEMKNTQSGVFYLLTILFYVRGLKTKGLNGQTGADWNYGLTLLFAVLAMASKSTTVVLPVVLVLCAWWMEGRWRWSHLKKLAPIIFMSGVATALGLAPRMAAVVAMAGQPSPRSWPQRLATSGDALWFYLGKLVWPHPLMAIYPRWQIDAGQWQSYLPLLAAIMVLIILWLKRETWLRPWFFAYAYFLVVLFPGVGLVDQPYWSYSFVQDHLQYLASMGPLALVGAGLVMFANSFIPSKLGLQSTFGLAVLLGLGVVSWQRVWVFQNEERLWTDTLAKNPYCAPAHYNLGVALFKKGQVDEAMAQLQSAFQIDPNNDKVHTGLGNVFLQKRQVDEAIAQYQKALAINPDYAEARDNLGNALFQKGRLDEAIVQYQEALEISPDYPFAHNNLGWALLQKGRVDEAMVHFQRALEINPNYAEAHYNLGLVLSKEGRMDEAMVEYQKALDINPNFLEACLGLGSALLQKGQVDEAMALSQKALEIDPHNAEAHYNLGGAFLQRGRLDEAIDQFQKALAINPNITPIHVNLGNALLQKGRLDEAIIQYQTVLKTSPDNLGAHNNLGMAFSLKGRWDEAIDQFQKALAINANITQIHINLGNALLKKGRVDEAVTEFQKALQLNPANTEAQRNLAKAQGMARGKSGSQ